MRLSIFKNSLLAAASLGVLSIYATPAMAQADAPDTAQADAANTKATVEEIVVTARRRSEKLQEIPDSITVLSADLLEDAGVNSLQDVTELVPNIVMFDSFRAGTIQLVVRGVTTPQNGEAPMSFVVDGVTVPEIDFINQDVFDVESIQIMRGPQGALYGRGALGGAVVINTKQPTDTFSGMASAAYESGGDIRIKGALSGPLVEDKVYFRVGGYYHDRDGQLYNSTNDSNSDFAEELAISGMLKFTPSENLDIALKAKYYDADLGFGTYQVLPNASLNDMSIPLDQNLQGLNTREIFETSLKINWDLDWAELTSVSAYADIKDEIISDADFGADVLFAQRNATEIQSYTQEFRLISPAEQKFRWMVGAFYQDRSKQFEFDFAGDLGLGMGPWAQNFELWFEQKDHTESRALGLFAQGNYDITDKLELTAALRYDNDKREFVDPRVAESYNEKTFNQLQPKFSLAYDWTDNVLAYVSYARGFRSGGFNEIGFATGFSIPSPTVYDKETSNSYEVGFKSSFMDNTIIINTALFHTDMNNNQYSAFDVDTFTLGILGIANAEINGIDLEVAVQPTDKFNFSIGLGVSDTTIDDFDGSGSFIGNAIPEVPLYTFNFAGKYTQPLDNGMNLWGQVNFEQRGKTFWNHQNTYVTSAKRYLDIRLAVESEGWVIAGYVDNLFDVQQPIVAFIMTDDLLARAPSRPRSFGAELKVKF